MKKSIILPAVLMPLITSAAFCLYRDAIDWSLLYALLPTALMSLGIPAAAKAVANGSKCSVYTYMTLMTMPFVLVCACSLFGIMPLATIAVFLTLPVAIGCSRTLYKTLEDCVSAIIHDLPARTATLSLLFCILLTLSLLTGKLI